ncbi:iron ABC transporter [Streptomyces agglomeratus]|uniref:Iron ABC transporter n=1 Tax=Streptomyces agglomeratus TaxID=285458 RepID=A0A1E5PAW2_9ACTN|nr:iron ABC transporter permease [Streptomyces agglomeratus]OEJ26693.1 iron ABC transporter [Streptomyces agglomeratus]OEJ39239.1 iron ABC transporter [Streptomyces agglomeratus]OEJ46378.1 iron ABC transporter [Streptomyces agglomeratus]
MSCETPAARGRLRYTLLVAALAALLAAAAVAGLALGSVRIPAPQVLEIVTGAADAGPYRTIVLDVRLPRVLLGAVVGAGLAVIGTVLQALVRNPLADPFLLGVSSGASVGAVGVIVLGIGAGLATTVTVPLAGFAGALASLVLVHALARGGGAMTTGRLLLAGVAVSYILSALTSLLMVTSARADHLKEILYWTLGGLGSARWDMLALPTTVLALGTALLVTLARPLDLLLAGEEGATVLGLDTGRFRAAVFVLASLLTGVLVAFSGAIGFVGLMVPHAARMAVGAGHRRLLPVAALGGAAFLVLADLAARTVAAPQDIPVGVLTALTGGPFFLWLLRRRAYGTTEGAPA